MSELDKRIKHLEKTLQTGINQNNGKPVKKEHVLALTASLMLLKKQKRNETSNETSINLICPKLGKGNL